MRRIYRNYIRLDLWTLSKTIKHVQPHRMRQILTKLSDSILMDGMEPEKTDEHDTLFTPQDIYEKELWESCRELARKDMQIYTSKIKSGCMGGRPKKIIDSEEEK